MLIDIHPLGSTITNTDNDTDTDTDTDADTDTDTDADTDTDTDTDTDRLPAYTNQVEESGTVCAGAGLGGDGRLHRQRQRKEGEHETAGKEEQSDDDDALVCPGSEGEGFAAGNMTAGLCGHTNTVYGDLGSPNKKGLCSYHGKVRQPPGPMEEAIVLILGN